MSYKINKYADKKEFIVEFNHKQGLMLQDGAEIIEGVFTEFTYALLPNEIMHTEQAEVEIDVLDYETRIETYEEPIFDEYGEVIGYNTIEQEVQVPIMVTIEEVILVPIFDEEGNFIGEEEQTVTREVQSTHKEMRTVTLRYPVINPNYEAELELKERERVSKLTCTKRVFALMLQELGITYTQLKALISTNEQAQLEWDLCVELERKNPLLDVMALQLGITSEQLDGLFKYANAEITIEQFKELASNEVKND
jgi:hypothetical protein